MGKIQGITLRKENGFMLFFFLIFLFDGKKIVDNLIKNDFPHQFTEEVENDVVNFFTFKFEKKD